MGADRRGTGLIAVAVGLGASGGHADPLGRARPPVALEHIGAVVRVAGHQVRRARRERHVAPIGADRRGKTGTVGLGAVGGHADPPRGARPPVAHEHVVAVVRVAGHQVRRARRERHVAPIGADRRGKTGTVGLGAVGGHADPPRGARPPVAHEHVVAVVRVAGHQVRRARRERHVAPIGADRRGKAPIGAGAGGSPAAVAVALGAIAGHADPLGERTSRDLRHHRKPSHRHGDHRDYPSHHALAQQENNSPDPRNPDHNPHHLARNKRPPPEQRQAQLHTIGITLGP